MTDDTRRHITVSEYEAISGYLQLVLGDPRIDRVKLKLRKKNTGLSEEDEQAAIRNGAPCFLSIVVRADPMPEKSIWSIERELALTTRGRWCIEGEDDTADTDDYTGGSLIRPVESPDEDNPDPAIATFHPFASGPIFDRYGSRLGPSDQASANALFVVNIREEIPALCRALRQAKAMIPRESYFASLKGAKKWVAYRLREIRIEGKPLPGVLKYNVSVRTQVAGEYEEGDDE